MSNLQRILCRYIIQSIEARRSASYAKSQVTEQELIGKEATPVLGCEELKWQRLKYGRFLILMHINVCVCRSVNKK